VDGSDDQLAAAKQAAAEAAALLVEDGMTVGLGTGSTVAQLLPVLAERELDLRCVATSPATVAAARAVGLDVVPFQAVGRLDIAIDGADQVAPDGWLVKGGGAAHTREKLVAAAADRFVVIVDPTKLVDSLEPPVPLELLAFGLASTLRRLEETVGPVRRRKVAASPDGGVICDYLGPVGDPAARAESLSTVPGVVEHGLFPPALVSDVLVGHASARPDGTRVERREIGRAR
jgi:ribose 5-phosphate isomerase A